MLHCTPVGRKQRSAKEGKISSYKNGNETDLYTYYYDVAAFYYILSWKMSVLVSGYYPLHGAGLAVIFIKIAWSITLLSLS